MIPSAYIQVVMGSRDRGHFWPARYRRGSDTTGVSMINGTATFGFADLAQLTDFLNVTLDEAIESELDCSGSTETCCISGIYATRG